ncbi:MAG: hypothetical protein WA421_13985 [Nitrososphaeraceae archaeon]
MPKENGFVYQYKQQDVRHVSERYIAKSDPYIVLVSTPNGSGGSFERIDKMELSKHIDRIHLGSGRLERDLRKLE